MRANERRAEARAPTTSEFEYEGRPKGIPPWTTPYIGGGASYEERKTKSLKHTTVSLQQSIYFKLRGSDLKSPTPAQYVESVGAGGLRSAVADVIGMSGADLLTCFLGTERDMQPCSSTLIATDKRTPKVVRAPRRVSRCYGADVLTNMVTANPTHELRART
ncbi:hypothetical protein EVAR_52234_1 [Eumeta japonica]|uniref:Uncharacterized protein n=1 Tax=Eumeta variegata TaxID=151549 RepID=A0A4C1Z3A5_EUMVA|nr:hypothetical protein EVAR_52234_1 [Eumeta japonica]